ncbi:MAG: GntR family transcriptional regulator [Erysipelotrichaceae bacterium]|nr:GntR family transcriptional regulator [Erysipelotrichaceae bacterium]
MKIKEAKYKQIEDFFIAQIEQGELKYGDQIMTEAQLCQKFSSSRMTVNKAMNHLSEKGYITRIPGKGSFVQAPAVAKDSVSTDSFTEDMRKIGMKAGSKLLTYQALKASDVPEVRDKLNLNNDDLVHYIVRLRSGNGMPVAISYGYVSARVVPAIDIESLNQSFYEYLDTIGIPRVAKTMQFSARLPNEEQKKLLGISETALLCVSHITYTEIRNEIVPFEYIENYYNGDLYTYTSR